MGCGSTHRHNHVKVNLNMLGRTRVRSLAHRLKQKLNRMFFGFMDEFRGITLQKQETRALTLTYYDFMSSDVTQTHINPVGCG